MEQSEQIDIAGAKPGAADTTPLPPRPKPKKKTALAVLTAILLLGLACGTLWAIYCIRHDEDASGENCGHVNGDNDVDSDAKPEEPANEVVELSINDELVQRLYRNFDHVSFPSANRFLFYIDKGLMSGNPDKKQMLNLARNNTVTRFCKGDYRDQFGVRYSTCYSGSEIAQKIEEIFGKKVKFTEDDIIEGRGCFGWYYDSANDEFYQISSGCGDADPRRVARKLYAAEMDSSRVYLYEFAIYTDIITAYHIGDGELAGDPIGNLTDIEVETYYGSTLQGDVEKYEKLLDQDRFKWTFVWNGRNYIFESLKKI